jgi:ribosomal protein S18 acetylase RimI-like enzyme
LKIVSLEDGYEQDFWKHVNRDPLDYYFFILDKKQHPEKTRIFLALEEKRIKGLMLLYADHIVQLRGSREAAKALFEKVDLEQVELQAPLDCEDIVLRRYQPSLKFEIVLMRLSRGDENLTIKHVPARLGIEDIKEFVELLREADPDVWGDLDVEQQKASWKDTFMLGIRDRDKLVSVGNTRFGNLGSNIGVIATEKHHRNMGFATSIVSALVQEILKNSPVAIIHVRKDNGPAVRAYSNVGFKPYKQYLMMRGTRTSS